MSTIKPKVGEVWRDSDSGGGFAFEILVISIDKFGYNTIIIDVGYGNRKYIGTKANMDIGLFKTRYRDRMGLFNIKPNHKISRFYD